MAKGPPAKQTEAIDPELAKVRGVDNRGTKKTPKQDRAAKHSDEPATPRKAERRPDAVGDVERGLKPPTVISFPDQRAIIGNPEFGVQPDTSIPEKIVEISKNVVKSVSLLGGDYPYNSFELTGPPPPRVALPEEIVPGTDDAKRFAAANAVGYWLYLHRKHIKTKARDYGVNRIAIAGAIAWEALVNPYGLTHSAIGPGKMHVEGEDGEKGWPEVIEQVYPGHFNARHRRNMLRSAEGAISYIAACLDIVARIAETHGFEIRSTPEVQLLAYHGYTAEKWQRTIAAKKKGSLFQLAPETMSTWVIDNHEFLAAAVDAK